MNENLDLTKILKGCPKGTKFYSSYLGKNVIFIEIYDNHIKCEYSSQIDSLNCSIQFRKDGSLYPGGDCMLFPSKDQRDWSKWQRPFVDGDVAIYINRDNTKSMFIYKEVTLERKGYYSYCWFNEIYGVKAEAQYVGVLDNNVRLATEEEKQRLFKALKDNGYKWNADEKKLEKLEDMEDKGNISDGYHTFNELYEYRLLYNASMFNELAKQGLYDVHKSKKHSDGTIPFGDENWFIVQAELPTGQISNHYEMKDWDLFKIPEKEKANPYDGHTPKDVAKRLRDFLTLEKLIVPKFKVGDKIRHKTANIDYVLEISRVYDDSYGIVGCGWMVSMEYQNEYELVPNKFNPKTLQPFDKVLVRKFDYASWCADLYSCYDECGVCVVCTSGVLYNFCIPYNNDTKHLVGKRDNAPEYYRYWEE